MTLIFQITQLVSHPAQRTKAFKAEGLGATLGHRKPWSFRLPETNSKRLCPVLTFKRNVTEFLTCRLKCGWNIRSLLAGLPFPNLRDQGPHGPHGSYAHALLCQLYVQLRALKKYFMHNNFVLCNLAEAILRTAFFFTNATNCNLQYYVEISGIINRSLSDRTKVALTRSKLHNYLSRCQLNVYPWLCPGHHLVPVPVKCELPPYSQWTHLNVSRWG